MAENIKMKYVVLPNHNDVALPNIKMTLLATNAYDKKVFANLKTGDDFVMSYCATENAYGDFDNIVLPSVKTVATLCSILSIEEQELTLKVTIVGKQILDLSDFVIDEKDKVVKATGVVRTAYDRQDDKIYEALSKFSTAYVGLRKQYPSLPSLPDFTQEVTDMRMVAYYIAVFLNSAAFTKQTILEEKDPVEKIRIVTEDLERFNLDSKIEYEIQNRVSKAIDKNQREYVLREKMKVVKDELKEFDGGGQDEVYLKKITDHPENYPENIQKRIKAELNRIKLLPAGAQEVGIIYTYLDLLVNLPWRISSVDNENFESVKAVLEKNHHGLKKQKERILQYLAVKQLTHSLKAPILCFYGAPGVGKTSLAISIAEALGRKFTKLALGGISDEAEIRGHRRTYVGALPGKIISQINKCGSNNPVFLLDEIDKIDGGGYRGDPASALLEVLDPEQNQVFTDNYLDEPFDLSNVMFICTANDISKIPGPLLDRLEMIELNTYTKFEKLEIAKTHLLKMEEEANGVKDGMMSWNDDAIDYIVEYYTREAGVRELRRKISTIDRKYAVDYLNDPKKNSSITIDIKAVQKYLGPEIFLHEKNVSDSQIGIINGLAYTDAGGEVLEIETTTYPGRGNLILTGNLGDVMKEACSTALSYVRSIGSDLGINPEFFTENDIHIHFPEGATPKDGPSAGVATVMVIISAICGVRIRNDVAMTGEVDLRGNAMPIGGLREKCNAASREHIKTVFIPKENHRDRLELPKEIADALEIVEVKKVDELFSKVFLDDLSKMKDKIFKNTTPKKDKNKADAKEELKKVSSKKTASKKTTKK